MMQNQRRIAILLVALFLVLLWSIAQTQPRLPFLPPETIRPPEPPVRLYRLYLPLVAKPMPKRGIGMPYPICADAIKLGASWQYGWSPQPIQCSGIDNVPMMWGASQVESEISESTWLLGFNEPERPEQANLTPQAAAIAWHRIEERFPDRRLVSPATMGGLGQQDIALKWMRDWRTAYIAEYGIPPRVDAIAFHVYGWGADSFIEISERYKALATEWDVENLWLTEFAMLAGAGKAPCWGNSFETQLPEAQRFINYLDSDPMIARYAWFASRIDIDAWYAIQPNQCNSPLIDFATGELTGWGKWYSR